MIAIRTKVLFLILCFVEAIWLLVAQVLGNTALLLPCLGCFLALAVWSAIKGMALPVFLFFLPFAPLLKIRPGAISFFTIALIAVYLVYLAKSFKKTEIYHLVPGLLVIALTFVVKAGYGYDIDNSYLLFALSLLLVPFLSKEAGKQYDFFWLTLYFSFGIAFAAITAQYLAVFPTISRYIGTKVLLGVVRRSGYYGDPNFYSAHITAAFSAVLVLIGNTARKRKVVLLFLLAMLLLYCGLLSVSKMFLLVAVCLILFWMVDFIFKKGKLSLKLMILLTFAVGAVFLLSSTVFTDLIDQLLARFLRDNSLSDFTTRRSELWLQYLRTFAENPAVLWFGHGYTAVTVNGRASHNTVIQGLFQFGITGCTLLAAWAVCFARAFLAGIKVRLNILTQIFILLIGTFGPWMALDYFFFDEFFLIPLFACVGIAFVAEASAKRETEDDKGSGI